MSVAEYRISLLPERLRRRVRIAESGCWEWTGAPHAGGYGRLRLGGGERKILAHRLAYQVLVGPIPEGLQIDHLCRNRACVNPAHLEPVTCRENILRGNAPAARNAEKTSCDRGHPLSGENLVWREGNNRGDKRECRACHLRRSREYEARIRARRSAS